MKRFIKSFGSIICLIVFITYSFSLIGCKKEDEQYYVGDTLTHKGVAITFHLFDETEDDWFRGYNFEATRIICAVELKNNGKYPITFFASDFYLVDTNDVKIYYVSYNLFDNDYNEMENIQPYETGFMFVYFSANDIFKRQALKLVYTYTDYDTENYVEYVEFVWNLAEKPEIAQE